MASRRQPPAKPERPKHSIAEKLHDIKMIEQRIGELEAFDPQSVTSRFNDPNVKVLETAIEETLADVFGNETDDYQRYSRATSLDHGPVSMSVDLGGWGGRADDSAEARQNIAEGKAEALALLRQARRRLNEEIEREQTLTGAAAATARPAVPARASSQRVFIVHGRDGEMREAVARFLTEVGFEPVILHEQPNGGRTVIEKFEAHSEPAGFAVVLLSGDDEGQLKGATAVAPRARQNVILELGYFVGHFGRARVCALKRGDLELPSDIVGVIFEPFDDAGAWKQVLARELENAGYTIDWNRVMGRRGNRG